MRRHSALLLCAFAASLQAQTRIPAVDSAAAARAAWSRAVRADDLAVSRREVERAAAAWPTQAAYVWGRVIFAAQARDTAAVFAALRDYADLELGRDLAAVPELDFIRTTPAFGKLASRHADNRVALARSVPVATLSDSTFWAEGVDYDPVDETYYIADVRHGTVARVGRGGREKLLWPRDSLRLGAAMGVRVDAKGRTLWVTTSGVPQNATFQPRDTALAFLLAVDLRTGRIARKWELPVVPGGHVLGDLAIGPRGDIWITDSVQPALYRLRVGSDTLETIRSPLFRSLQGVVVTPDNATLFVADYSHGLLRMDIASGALARLADAPHSTSLGCDGLAWYRGSLVAVQNGVWPARVVRFHLTADQRAISRAEVIDRNVPLADEPTIGTIVNDRFVFVANSQWEKHDEAGRVRAGVTLAPARLLALPLK